MILYRAAQGIVRLSWPLLGRLQVQGRDNIPPDGPFLLVANHQSYLDPILIQTVCPRPVHAMAKSTQFATPFLGWLMKRLLSFPVRRWEIDPQAVRLMLRRLDHGDPVCVYIEGERSWDGRLQAPRLGTLRVLLKAGVPVVPVAIAGTYHVWPRWDRKVRRGNAAVVFGRPMRFPQSDDRAERNPLVPQTAERLMTRLQELLDEAEAVREGRGGP